MKKMVNGIVVDMSAEEIAQRQEEESQWLIQKAEYDAKEYQRKRAAEYPPIGDQLDALWKGGAEAEAMLAKVQAVKARFPKGVK